MEPGREHAHDEKGRFIHSDNVTMARGNSALYTLKRLKRDLQTWYFAETWYRVYAQDFFGAFSRTVFILANLAILNTHFCPRSSKHKTARLKRKPKPTGRPVGAKGTTVVPLSKGNSKERRARVATPLAVRNLSALSAELFRRSARIVLSSTPSIFAVLRRT
jgi:hypothetical protein